MRFARALPALVLPFVAACTQRAPQLPPASPPPPALPGAAVFSGAAPATMILDGTPLDVDPSGAARFLVRARFEDADGRPTDLISGGDVEFTPSRGNAQWQTRLRFGGPAAIVATRSDGPLTVHVRASVGPRVPSETIATDTRRWHVARVVARALGPHAVWIGWFPHTDDGVVRITRRDPRGGSQSVTLAAPASTYRDEAVQPGRGYRYEIAVPGQRAVTLRVPVPPEIAGTTLDALRGKGVWLSFSPSTADADGYDKLGVPARLALASQAGLHSIVLRTAYGPFDELTGDARPAIDALIDGAASRGIATVAWTVPRTTDYDDLAAAVGSASYVTAGGRHVAALAVDLDRGDYFMGSGVAGHRALASYLRLLRGALGPHYPIVATIEDPSLEHLGEADYPYREIAASADALEPMAYWPLLSRGAASPKAIAAALGSSDAATVRLAARPLPIILGVQSSPFGARPAPGLAEIRAAVTATHALDALGIAFFDWNGTPPQTWRAIAASR